MDCNFTDFFESVFAKKELDFARPTHFQLGIFDEPYGTTQEPWDKPLGQEEVFKLFQQVNLYLSPRGTFVYFLPWHRLPLVMAEVTRAGLVVRGLCVWAKRNPPPAPPTNYYGPGESGREFFLVIGKSGGTPVWREAKQPAGTAPHMNHAMGVGIVYFSIPKKAMQKGQKPHGLIEWLIRWYVETQLRLKPFFTSCGRCPSMGTCFFGG